MESTKIVQFRKWENNLEKDVTKIEEEKVPIRKIEYKGLDRYEKQMDVIAYKVTRPVTKAYYERAQLKPFGIGTNFDDLKTNSVISTVQRENVWHPFYEINLEEMDFKEKMIAAAEEKKMQNLGGTEIQELTK